MTHDLVVLTLCHRRAETLKRTLQYWLGQFPYSCVLLAPDRPTPEVRAIVNQYRPHPNVMILPVPPVMSPQAGQCWTTVRNHLLDMFDLAGRTADWEVNGDDDRWFQPDATDWLHTTMANPDVWCIRAVSAFIWDEDGNINARQIHDEPLFGRYQKGWRRDGRFHSQVATQVLDHTGAHPESSVYCPYYLLDYGSQDQASRERLYNDYVNAGKLSTYTRRYVLQPHLMTFDEVKRMTPQEYSQWQHERFNPHCPPERE